MGEYTIASDDQDHYNRIYAYFEPIASEMATMTVTGLTTNCCIKVLKIGDYIVINGINYQFVDDYTSMNQETFIGLLNDFQMLDIIFSLDNCRRILIKSTTFGVRINDASYNVRLLMGLHPFDELDLFEEYEPGYITTLELGTVGFMLSTPVLYLTSNIGAKAYMNNQRSKSTQNSKILMRINNSFSANYLIIAGNAEFSTYVSSNDLSSVEFTLVDANMMEIELLSPMYLSVSIKKGDVEEKLMTLTKSVAGAMNWAESMKNNDSNRRAAELRSFDTISTLSADDQFKLMNAHNSR